MFTCRYMLLYYLSSILDVAPSIVIFFLLYQISIMTKKSIFIYVCRYYKNKSNNDVYSEVIKDKIRLYKHIFKINK